MDKTSGYVNRSEDSPALPPRPRGGSGRHRLVVGVDYGTTYSGVSFVTTDKSSIDDIQVISSWPAQETHSWKVPTRIAYAKENQHKRLKTDAWGCAVRADMVSCSWTKLLLDQKAVVQSHDDPYLRHAMDEGILHIPHSKGFCKTPQDVCADFLAKLYSHVMEKITDQIGEAFLASTPMDCWLTVPAVWSDKAQDLTTAAARAAGFGSRPGDNVYIIPEPEAAALATFKAKTKPNAPNAPEPGENIVVCDAGGGTVDISTYKIVETSPSLIFDELCVGIGGKCGSTWIDRNLLRLMEERFGEDFAKVEMRRKGPGSMFMNSWEREKKSYRHERDRRDDQQDVELGPLKLDGEHPDEWYDKAEGMVLLSSDDLERLFKPVVAQVLELLNDQVCKAAADGEQIKRIILVGGFADSHYLTQSVRGWGLRRGSIQVLCGAHPQAAIVQGAALRGLEGTAPRQRKMRRHYGFPSNMSFREGIDPESRAVWNRVDGVKRCQNRVNWMISKGTTIKSVECRKQSLVWDRAEHECMITTIPLLSYPHDELPDYAESGRIETIGNIKVDLTAADKSKLTSRRIKGAGGGSSFLGVKHWNFTFDLEVTFGAASSNLIFRTLVDGKVQGTASIVFE